MADIGTLTTTLGVDLRPLNRSVDKAKGSFRRYQDAGVAAMKNVQKAMMLVTAAAAAIGIYQAQKVAKESVALANIQEKAEMKLRAVINATGQAAGYTADEMIKMAGAMQKVTTFGDEMIIGGMAILATFKNIRGEAFERTTKAALDMSTVMGTDVKSSLLMMSKAMNDPIANLSAMSRAGVQFNEEQKELIKTLWESGRQLDAQRIILNELESEFGKAAEEIRKTFGGSVDAARNTMGDLKEEMGFVITKSRAWIDLAQSAEQVFIKWGEAVEKLRKEGKLDEWAKNAAKGVVTAFENMTKAAQFFATIIPKIRKYMGSLAEVGFKGIRWWLKRDLEIQEKWLEEAQNKLVKFRKENRGELFGDYTDLKLVSEYNKLVDKAKEYQTTVDDVKEGLADTNVNIEAAGMMMEENAKIVDRTNEGFKNIYEEIRGIKTGLGEAVKETEKLGKASSKVTFSGATMPPPAISEGLGINYMANYEIVTAPILSTFQEIINLFSASGEVFKGEISESGKLMFEATTSSGKAIEGAGEIFGMQTMAAGLNFAVAIGEAVISILGVIEDIINLPRRIVEAFTSLFRTIGDFGKLLTDALDDLIDSLPYMIEGLGDVFVKLIPKLINVVPQMLLEFHKALPTLIDAVIDSIPLIADALVKQIQMFIIDLPKQMAKTGESLVKDSIKLIGVLSGFDFILKGLKSVFGGGRKRKYLGGEMDVGYEGGLPSATMTDSWARRVGAEAQTQTEQTMMDTAINVLKGYQELVESMGEGVSDTFYANVKDMLVSVYAKATRSAALARRFGKSLEKMAEELQEQLDIYLGEAIRQYGQSAISTISQMGLKVFLAPSADIFHQTKLLQKQLMNSADMSAKELSELVKQIDNLANAAKNITKTWKDIQYQMKVATGEASQLDQEMYQVNQMFDTWREQMEVLGATQKVLSDIEQNRAKAIERLMNVETRALEQIDKLLASLGATGEFAPVQSMEAYQVKYAGLQQAVLSAKGIADIESAVDAMTAFVPDYIKFMEGYGGDYAQLIQGIQAEMQTMRGIVQAVITTMGHARGGLTSGLGFVGEKGPEWVVPTYEPERSSFLGNLGLSPEALGRAIAQNIESNSNNQSIEVNVYIDGQPIRDAVTTGLRGRDTELIQAVRRAA